ncbi:nuclear transport factor 2 family protein [Aureitalea sp. L0-47]|uniref:YybH family protein n=1 Tax=Aureitalea sp. L0-47 TaxID=2816962 RepID=UPI0022385994|nr:nuclear transport factor 2 family protein [Aureitalea sp. L0-47]MCW5518580.1 nuclear transport factor 2 family protein [Aureitalea sp. L0-47]
MKKYLFVLFALFTITIHAQSPDEAAILEVMKQQEEAWNNFDLEAFMEGYWKSDSLKFFGKSGVTHGWEQTLERYKKGYPDKSNTGTLNFKIEEISPIETKSYYVMGRYYLTRDAGDAEGIFMIIFRKIDGEWKIISDTSCG